MKLTTSDDSSWASIVKRSLKTKVPKMNFDFMDTSNISSTSSSKQKIESTNGNNSPEEESIVPTETSPPLIINISDDEDLSSIESLFMTSKNEPNQDQTKYHHPKKNKNVFRSILTKNRQCRKYKTTTRQSLATPSSLPKMIS